MSKAWLRGGMVSLCLLFAGAVVAEPTEEVGVEALRAQAQAQGAVRVIVRLREGHVPEAWLGAAQGAEQRQRIGRAQALVLERLGRSPALDERRFQTLPYLALAASPEELDALAASDLVAEVLPDRVVRRALADSVPHVGAPTAWNLGYAGAGQVIAILDDGVAKDHPFLAGKVVEEACYLMPLAGRDAARDACPDGDSTVGPGAAVPPEACADGCAHGTHVAGIAAGRGAEDEPSGVARDADLIAVRVLDSAGRGLESDLLMGLEFIYDLRETHPVAAINMSLSGDVYTGACDHRGGPVRAMFEQLRAAGIAPVVATGNNAAFGAIGFPSCLSSAIAVGAIARADDIVPIYSNNATMVDLLAPGGTEQAPIVSSLPGGGFGGFYGTSMAAPHVAGAFAIMRSRYPEADLETLLLWLKLTGRPVEELLSGSSIVNPRIGMATAIEADSVAPDAPTYDRLMGTTETHTERSGSGCTLRGGRPDPLLPLLLLMAAVWLVRRRA
ncbi:S8 family serine peptidase [Ectothiorhodospiraceae bacterium 2226]|nr:S8 family serine peptidase [Ectothiorhodospiraceae bacterium 2226]